MAFPHGIVPVFVPVYPTPLYELAAGLLIGWWLWWRLGKPHATGAIVGQYLIARPAWLAFWLNLSAATPRFYGDYRMRNWPAPEPSWQELR